MVTSCSVRSSGTEIAATRPAGDFLDRRLDVVGIVIAPIYDQEVLDAAHDEQFALGNDTEVSGPQPRTFWCSGRGLTSCAPNVRSVCSGLRQ